MFLEERGLGVRTGSQEPTELLIPSVLNVTGTNKYLWLIFPSFAMEVFYSSQTAELQKVEYPDCQLKRLEHLPEN